MEKINYHLPPNYLLNNRYSLIRMIGQGGFGITYEAIDEMLETKVCIKELFVSGQNTRGTNMSVLTQEIKDFSFDDFVKRFLDEARQLAKFNHLNIVSVKDIFRFNGTAYMVMSFMEGETLKQLINREGAMSSEAAMPLFNQILDAVEKVHEAGMLHRDIKPDNILISPEKRAVLIDFGSARDFIEGKTITQTAMLTPGYAPIEQYGSKKQRGAYTDIYALGATLYFMLTGTKPLDATDRYTEEMPLPHVLNSKISTQLSSVVMLAMQMKAEDRFKNVKEMKIALEQFFYKNNTVNYNEKALNKPNQVKFTEKSLNYQNKSKMKGIIITFILCVLSVVLTYLIVNEQVVTDKDISEPDVTELFFTLDKGFKHSNELVDANVSSQIKLMKATLDSKPSLKPLVDAADQIPDKIETLLNLINKLRLDITDQTGGLYTLPDKKSKWEGYGYKKLTFTTDKKLDGKPIGYKDKQVTSRIFIDQGQGEVLKKQIYITRKELHNAIEELNVKLTREPIFRLKLDLIEIEKLKNTLVLEDPDDMEWQSAGNKNWSEYVFADLSVISCYTLLSKLENDAKNSAAQIVNFLSDNMGYKVLVYDKFDVFSQSKKAYIRLGETYEAEIGLGAFSTQSRFNINVNGTNLAINGAKARYLVKPTSIGTQRYTATINVENPMTGKVETVRKDFEFEVGP